MLEMSEEIRLHTRRLAGEPNFDYGDYVNLVQNPQWLRQSSSFVKFYKVPAGDLNFNAYEKTNEMINLMRAEGENVMKLGAIIYRFDNEDVLRQSRSEFEYLLERYRTVDFYKFMPKHGGYNMKSVMKKTGFLKDIFKEQLDVPENLLEAPCDLYQRSIENSEPTPYLINEPGTLFTSKIDFNLDKLIRGDRLTSGTVTDNMSGITSSMVYVGVRGSVFPAHLEDWDLGSMNYLHYGAPKMYVIIPPSQAEQFQKHCLSEMQAAGISGKFNPYNNKPCDNIIQHKNFIVLLDILRAKSIKFKLILQFAQDLVLLMPGCYHFGCNLGMNVAESRNFMHAHYQETKILRLDFIPCSCGAQSKISEGVVQSALLPTFDPFPGINLDYLRTLPDQFGEKEFRVFILENRRLNQIKFEDAERKIKMMIVEFSSKDRCRICSRRFTGHNFHRQLGIHIQNHVVRHWENDVRMVNIFCVRCGKRKNAYHTIDMCVRHKKDCEKNRKTQAIKAKEKARAKAESDAQAKTNEEASTSGLQPPTAKQPATKQNKRTATRKTDKPSLQNEKTRSTKK